MCDSLGQCLVGIIVWTIKLCCFCWKQNKSYFRYSSGRVSCLSTPDCLRPSVRPSVRWRTNLRLTSLYELAGRRPRATTHRQWIWSVFWRLLLLTVADSVLLAVRCLTLAALTSFSCNNEHGFCTPALVKRQRSRFLFIICSVWTQSTILT